MHANKTIIFTRNLTLKIDICKITPRIDFNHLDQNHGTIQTLRILFSQRWDSDTQACL